MKHIPKRMCIVCRKMYPKQSLIRIVRENGTGDIKLDTANTLMGRGAYICRNAECIGAARKRRGIERHLKSAVPKDMYTHIEDLIR